MCDVSQARVAEGVSGQMGGTTSPLNGTLFADTLKYQIANGAKIGEKRPAGWLRGCRTTLRRRKSIKISVAYHTVHVRTGVPRHDGPLQC